MKRNKNTNSFKRNGMTDTEREIIQSRAGLETKDGKVVLDKKYRIHPQSCTCDTCAVPGFWYDWLNSVQAYYKVNADCIYETVNGEEIHSKECYDTDNTSCSLIKKTSNWVFSYLAEKYPEELALYKLMRTAKLRKAYHEGDSDTLYSEYNDMILKNYSIAFKAQDSKKKNWSSTTKGYKVESPFELLKTLK
jgi:hypothetical protein